MRHVLRWMAWVTLGWMIIPTVTLAQNADSWKMDVNGQIRVRNEVDDRDFNSETDAYDFSLLRTRVNLKGTFNDKLVAFVQLQDSRRYGDNSGTLVSTDNVDIHQAYFQINRLFWKWLTIKSGRMELAYDNERLIGAVGWSNVGRSFDGGVTTLDFKPITIDLFSAIRYESMKAPDATDGDITLGGIHAKTHFLEGKTLNFYILADQDEQQNQDEDPIFQRGTLGAYFNGTFGGLNAEAELAFQGGTIRANDSETDIAAAMLTAAVNYSFKGKMKPKVGLGIDMLSGDDPETEEYECFDTLYGTNHKFYGYMDYFINIPAHTQNKGLTDLMVKGSFDPHEKVTVSADIHMFSLGQDATLADGSESKSLGSEVDLTCTFRYMKPVQFVAGLSVFSPGDVYKEWKGEDGSFWAYAQTIINF